MKVYVCEKPSQAGDVVKVLGGGQRKDGYTELRDGSVVTWAIGHLLELQEPKEYRPEWGDWNQAVLPMIPERWKRTIKPSAAKQYKVVAGLMKQATELIIATDADQEGSLIFWEIYWQLGLKTPTKRARFLGLDDANIKKALANLAPGQQDVPMAHAADARSKADWLLGLNLTRCATLVARAAGADGIFKIGRVQTPTLGLVVRRELEIRDFKAKDHFEVEIEAQHANGNFKAKWKPAEALLDPDGQLIDRNAATQVTAKVKGHQGRIAKHDTKPCKETQPKGFSLTSLTVKTSALFGMGGAGDAGGRPGSLREVQDPVLSALRL